MPTPQQNEIIVNGRVFISLKYAAELSNYTHDYVGQRARNGYLASQKVNGERYVDKDEFIEYARETGKLIGAEQTVDGSSESFSLHRENTESVFQSDAGNALTHSSDDEDDTEAVSSEHSTSVHHHFHQTKSSSQPFSPYRLRGAYVTRSFKTIPTRSVNTSLSYSNTDEEDAPLMPEIKKSSATHPETTRMPSVAAPSLPVSEDETIRDMVNINGNEHTLASVPRKVIQVLDVSSRRPVGAEVRTPSSITQASSLILEESNQHRIAQRDKVMHIVDDNNEEYNKTIVRKPASEIAESGLSIVSESDRVSVPQHALTVYVPKVLALPQEFVVFFQRQSPLVKVLTLSVPVAALVLVLTAFNIFGSLDQSRPTLTAQAAYSPASKGVSETLRQGIITIHSAFSFVADRINERMLQE